LEVEIRRHGHEPADTAQRHGKAAGSVQKNCCRAYFAEHGFKGCHRKKALTPDEKRSLVEHSKENFKLSLRQACLLFSISTSVFYYESKRKNDDPKIVEELLKIVRVNTSWGFWMSFHRLRQMQFEWNHKRVYRVYKSLKLNLRLKHKKRLPARVKEPLTRPIYPNIVWSMDFMSDSLINGKKVRSLNIIDDYNREILTIEIGYSLASDRVIKILENLIEWRGKPMKIRIDNGPEFIANRLKEWCQNHEIELLYIQPGKPTQNSLIERFNRTFREDILDKFVFESIPELRNYAHAWMWMYNNERPHAALGYLTPRDFLLKYGKLNQQYGQEFSTFQQNNNSNNWQNLVLNVTR
jgi:putative transposase